MKFAIWGAGQKGRIAIDALGQDNISCFIDSNVSLHGREIKNTKIISFQEYIKNNKNDLILISMLDCSLVIEKLDKIGIPYVMWEKSSRILEKDYLELREYYNAMLRYMPFNNITIYGVNVLSILLYDFFIKSQKQVTFLNLDVEKSLQNFLVANGYKFKNSKPHNLIVTDDTWQQAVERYPNVRIFNISDLFVSGENSRYEELQKFKDIHKNKRCFIVGNGPSLQIGDLNKLADNGEICFATNMIYKIFSKTSWRPQYYVVIDMVVLEKYGEQIKKLNLPCLFMGSRRTGFWNNVNNPRIYAFNDLNCSGMDLPFFSEDLARCAYSYYTVTYTCIQFAVYMGFKEIFLLGIDANYTNYASDKSNHFIEDYYDKDDAQKIPVDLERHFKAYQVAENYTRRRGVKIYNATRGGMLEVFERVDFDSLF